MTKIFTHEPPDNTTVNYYRFTIQRVNDGDVVGSTGILPPNVVINPTTGQAWVWDWEAVGTDQTTATTINPEAIVAAAH